MADPLKNPMQAPQGGALPAKGGLPMGDKPGGNLQPWLQKMLQPLMQNLKSVGQGDVFAPVDRYQQQHGPLGVGMALGVGEGGSGDAAKWQGAKIGEQEIAPELMHETATKLEQIINDVKADPKMKAEATRVRIELDSLIEGRAKEVEQKYPVKPGSLSGKPDPFDALKFPPSYKNSLKTFDSSGSGGANYSAADLAALKARHGIK